SSLSAGFSSYDISCFDGRSSRFYQLGQGHSSGEGCYREFEYSDNDQIQVFFVPVNCSVLELQKDLSPDDFFKVFKAVVDKHMGKDFCYSWITDINGSWLI